MRARVILLCEDQAHDTFVRRFLKKRGFRPGEIRTVELPGGRQSGEQWVRSRYPDELKTVRSQSNAHLMVVTDADQYTTAERRDQLDRECDKRRIQQRTAGDRVIVVVPRRNVETWFEYLDGREVDEATEYPKRKAKDHRRLADTLYRMCHEQQRLEEQAPPSLSESCAEYTNKLRR